MTRVELIEQAIRDWFQQQSQQDNLRHLHFWKDGDMSVDGIFQPNALAMSIEQRIANEDQRRSFAFGNANIDNPAVTRKMVNEIADIEKRPHKYVTGGIGCKACGLGIGAYVHNDEARRLSEAQSDYDHGPDGDATTPGFFKKEE